MSFSQTLKEENPEPLKQTLCEICEKQFSNYICPRCNLRYCSLTCYRDMQHADCTESFYKQNVTEEIQSQPVNNENKTKMLSMLKRLSEEDEHDPLEQDELSELFQDLDLESADPEEVWRRLPAKERKEFESMLTRLDDVWHTLDLPDYIPWWRHGIQDREIPTLPSKLPNLTIESRPHLIWNLLHILLLYSYLMRHTTGNMLEDSKSTMKTAKTLSVHVLFSDAASCPFNNLQDVITDSVERILRLQDSNGPKARYELTRLLLQDLLLLVPYAKYAVWDLWQNLNKIRQKTKAIHKLYYYGAVATLLDMQHILPSIQDTLYKLDIEQKEFEKDCEAANKAIQMFKKGAKIQEIE